MEKDIARDGAENLEKEPEIALSAGESDIADRAKAERWRRFDAYRAEHPEEFDADGNLLPEFDPAVTSKVLARYRAEDAAQRDMPPWHIPVSKMSLDIVHGAPFPHQRVRAIPRDGDTEDLLNGLIAECHYIMREVALPTALLVKDASERARFLSTAMSLAQTGAKVGRAIAKLRGAGAVTEIRQRHITEQVVTAPAPSAEKELRT